MPLNTEHIPLILFSGGLDSTALLNEALDTYAVVDLVFVKLSGQEEQYKRQAKAVKNICDEFMKKHRATIGRIGRIRNIETAEILGCHNGALRLAQGHGWLFAALNNLRPDNTMVQVGYVLGDSAYSAIHDLTKAWEYLTKAACVTHIDHGYIPNLNFPLMYKTKTDLINSLDERILRHVVWCENTDRGNDCGQCPSCKRMMGELASFKIFYPEKFDASFLRKRNELMIKRYTANSLKPKLLLKGK